MITFWVLLVLSVLPGFVLISRLRTPTALLGVSAFLAMLHSLGRRPILISITESIPRHIRSGMVATIYALSISVFGGSTQFIITWLIHADGQPAGAGVVHGGSSGDRACGDGADGESPRR